MTIGFDLDDVLLDFNGSLHPYCNSRYGTSCRIEDISSFDLAKLWGISEEEKNKRVLDFYSSPEHWDARPVAGAIEGIRSLKQYHNLSIITAKPEGLKDRTNEWLETHFSLMFDDIHFVNHYGSGQRRSKGEVCKELGIEFFVDDSLENANDVVNLEIPVLLFNAPWNQAEVQSPITRVHSWEEIVRILSGDE